jgi:hypothetical protein
VKVDMAMIDERREMKFIPLIANGFSVSDVATTVDGSR